MQSAAENHAVDVEVNRLRDYFSTQEKRLFRTMEDLVQQRTAASTLDDMQAIIRRQHALIEECRIALTQLREEHARVIEQARLNRHRAYGASSEQSPDQVALFDEAEVLAAEPAEDEPVEDVAPTVAAPAKPRGKRTPLPAHLPRHEIIHELTPEELQCACGAEKVVIGTEISEQIDIIPTRVRVLRHVRKTCACPKCQLAPVTAAMPPQPIPKSNASANTLAFVATGKFVDGVPLYRLEKVLARYGIGIPRHTLARWMIACGDLLVPLINLLRDQLLAHDVLHMDETPLQVLKETGKTAQSQSYMWVQSGGPPGQRVVLFDYDASRSGAVPKALLGDYGGHLMTDGYEGYNAVVAANGITHLACWAHARRKFIEVQRAQPKGKTGSADVALGLIGKLYGIERDLKEVDNIEQRALERKARSVPVLNELRAWLDKRKNAVPPKSKLGEALAYLDKYWPKLIRYVKRGDLPIDNNRAENAIRPFVIGRKNWLFSDTPAGAHASARIYSLVETAKANGHEPHSYLCRVLRDLPAAKTVEDIEALLPWNLAINELVSDAAR